MKHILIVTPNWPPITCPDMHRVRAALPFLEEFGWEPLILKINPDEQEGIKDEILGETIPASTKTWQAGCIPQFWTRLVGVRSVGLRSFFHLARLGSYIIKTAKPDLIFFSTTMFPLMILGRYWKAKHGVPYVLDFQDPWLNDYYQRSKGIKPPGGYFKYWLSQIAGKILESFTLRRCTHIICVSPKYSENLLQRYSWLSENQFTVLPFGAPEADFELLPSLKIQQRIFDPKNGKRHWVYVGRGGNDMAFALRALFLAIRADRDRHPQVWDTIRLHFVGTSYAPGDRAVKTIEPLAQAIGIADLVDEQTQRLPYFEALQTLVDSDAILLIGSNDPGYTASKLYPCILARKPMLAIFHQQSSVVSILRECNVGRAITFQAHDQPQMLTTAITAHLNWLLSMPKGYQPDTNWAAFQPYTAREMTRKQCSVFDYCLAIANRETAP